MAATLSLICSRGKGTNNSYHRTVVLLMNIERTSSMFARNEGEKAPLETELLLLFLVLVLESRRRPPLAALAMEEALEVEDAKGMRENVKFAPPLRMRLR